MSQRSIVSTPISVGNGCAIPNATVTIVTAVTLLHRHRTIQTPPPSEEFRCQDFGTQVFGTREGEGKHDAMDIRRSGVGIDAA
jgi:hypothetical protein